MDHKYGVAQIISPTSVAVNWQYNMAIRHEDLFKRPNERSLALFIDLTAYVVCNSDNEMVMG